MTETTVIPRKERRLAALRGALREGSWRGAARMIAAMHPAEIALLIESLPPAQREVVWNFVEPEIEGDVLVELSDDVRQAFIEGMDADELLAAAENMELDDLADLVGDLPEAVSLQLVKSMDHAGPRAAEDRAVLRARHRRRPHEHRHGERARRRHRGSGAALPAHARRAAGQDRPPVRRRPQRPLPGHASR